MAIYLDYAAATPLALEVLAAMQPYLSDVFYNPSALYIGAREAKQAVEDARASVARNLGARPAEITFTAGGTESANLAIAGVMSSVPDGELLVSSIEHDAVLRPAERFKARLIPVDSKGVVRVDELKARITDKTVLISVMYANNEVGTVQPIREIVQLVDAVRKDRRARGVKQPLYVHTDACQAPQYLDINVARLGVDLMTLNGGKLYGPKQSGVLFHRTGVVLTPQIVGGGQEWGYRGGTENVAACVGFAKALDLSVMRRTGTVKALRELSGYFADELASRFGAVVNGHHKQRLPNNVHVTFPGADNERVLFSLDGQGIYAAAGSACSASDDEASHVLLAMGLNEAEARASLRFSLGRETTRAEIEQTLDALAIALKA